MVMTSDQIAAQAYAFQQQTMGGMQHSGMISQMAGAPMGQQLGQNMMGSAVNSASAYGAPLMTGAMSLAGVDPFSMGLRGAMAGGSRFGMMGALGGGLLGAGMVGAPLMAAQYAGGQMLQGMSQQQQLNQSLGQNYQFMGSQGQRGFTTGGMRDIGQQMRQMSMQQGPGGEFTSMNELTAMAGQMSQMGMMQNVRSVQDFSEKFKEQIKTVKEVAIAFQTNLEQALNVVNSMKSSGIFDKQGQIAQQVRDISQAGGLATQEVTAMMNVGSQISRSIGGRGQAGAMAGMKAIGNVGTMLQMGTISEEDIYNVTGLTGAEGRQAMAQRRLQQDASFLSSGLGRRMVASMAGADGTADMSSVEDLMYGSGGGTGGTMSRAHKNLGKIGRANFIRNEGRIRGAVLEQFGGMGQALQAKDWLESRGMDMNSDRAAVFLQRRFKHLSPDDIESLLKEVKDLPFAMQRQQDAATEGQMMRDVDRYKQHTGMRGVKHKLESFRNKVQGTLQQAGADFYSSGSEMINRFVNKLTGDFEVEIEKNLGPKIKGAFGATSQGVFGAHQRLTQFGLDSNWQRVGQDAWGRRATQGMFGGAGPSNSQVFKRSGDLERFRSAGWNLNASSDRELGQSLQGIRDIQAGFDEGYGGAGADQLTEFGRANTVAVQEAMLGEKRIYQGQRGLDQIGRIIDETTGSSSRLAIMYGQANAAGKAQLGATFMRGAGMGKTVAFMRGTPERRSISNMSQFATAGERQEAIGKYMYGSHTGPQGEVTAAQQEAANLRGDTAEVLTGASADILKNVAPGGQIFDLFSQVTQGGDMKSVLQNRIGGRARRTGTGDPTDTQQTAAARYLEADQGKELISRSMSSDAATAAEFQAEQYQRLEELRVKSGGMRGYGSETKLSDVEAGEYLARQSALVNSKFRTWKDSLGHDPSPEEVQEFVQDNKKLVSDVEDLSNQVGGLSSIQGRQYSARRKEAYRRMGIQGRTTMTARRKSGEWRGGALTASRMKELEGVGGRTTVGTDSRAGGESLAAAMGLRAAGEGRDELMGDENVSGMQKFEALMGQAAKMRENITDEDNDKNAALARGATGREQLAWETFGSRSLAEQRQMAGAASSVGVRREMKARIGMGQRLKRAGARGALGTAMEVSSQLGLDLDRDELGGGDPAKAAAAMTEELGFKKDEDRKKFQDQLETALSGKKTGADGKPIDRIGQLRALQDTAGKQQREKRKEEAKEDDPNHEVLQSIVKAITKGNSEIGKSTHAIATAATSGMHVIIDQDNS